MLSWKVKFFFVEPGFGLFFGMTPGLLMEFVLSLGNVGWWVRVGV